MDPSLDIPDEDAALTTSDQQQPAPQTVWGFVQSRIQSFVHAFHGWWYVMRTQRNAWMNAGIAIAAILVSFWLQLAVRDWVVIILLITMVFMAEFVNTAIEVVVDLASPQMHPLAKIAKDVGAAAVLITALAAVVIGLLLLGPPLWAKLAGLLAR
jgi:diacylglycerol kinase